MLRKPVKGVENVVYHDAKKAMKTARDATDAGRARLAEATDSATAALKAEFESISEATHDAVETVRAEVVKRPLTFTLAAAGAGALVGIGILEIFRLSRSAAH